MGKGDEDGVRRRGAGRWKARFTAQTAVGPKRKSVSGKTEAIAKRGQPSARTA